MVSKHGNEEQCQIIPDRPSTSRAGCLLLSILTLKGKWAGQKVLDRLIAHWAKTQRKQIPWTLGLF